MATQTEIQQLIDENEAHRNLAENKIVSGMFDGMLGTSVQLDHFSTWLLAGSAAVGAFMISNADKMVPFLGRIGFAWCGAALLLACLFGFAAKAVATFTGIAGTSANAAAETVRTVLAEFDKTEKIYVEAAENLGIKLDTGVRMEKVLEMLFKPAPFWVEPLTRSRIKKSSSDPHMGHLPRISALNKQMYFTIAQSVFFFAFLCLGFAFGASNG